MKIKEALFKGRISLETTESKILLSYVLKKEIIELYKNPDYELKENEVLEFEELVNRRKSGYPIQYLIGTTEFMGLLFKITPDVLIPRCETEILVDVVLKEAKKIKAPRIIDIGCGSGVIAVSIKKFLSRANVVATDISERALFVSRTNACSHNTNISFICSDLLSAIKGKFDIIIFNPPYVETDLVLEYEPEIALNGGLEGLDFYPRIFKEVKNLLDNEELLILEIGRGKTKDISKIGKATGFELKRIIKDYSGIERVMVFANKMSKNWKL